MAVEPAPLSATNPRIASLRRLSGRRKARLEAGRFIIEGPVPISELLGSGAELEELFIDLDLWQSVDDRSPLRMLVNEAVSIGVPVWGVSGSVFASVSDTNAPQGALATAIRAVSTIEDIARGDAPVVVLVDIADPGNAGTLVRTAEAAGCGGVIFAGTSTDAFGPKAVRAAAGSIARLPIAECGDVERAFAVLGAERRSLVASVVGTGCAPEDVDLTGSVAIVIGSEAHGLSAEVLARCDQLVTIPMVPAVDSMNAAVAGAVLLFESARQRRAADRRTT